MNGLDVLLHVLLNLVLIDVLESAILGCIIVLIVSHTGALLLHNHVGTKLTSSLGFLSCWHSIISIELVVAINSFARQLHRIELLLVIAIDIKHVDN